MRTVPVRSFVPVGSIKDAHDARPPIPPTIRAMTSITMRFLFVATFPVVGFVILGLGFSVQDAQAVEKAEEAAAAATEFSAHDLEFFENKVRPLLAARCYECHSADADELGGELRLDSRRLIVSGGDSGPAIVPHKPDESLLIESIHYGGTYEMPPDSKMSDDEIATLTKWVSLGAPWPTEADVEDTHATAKNKFPFEERLATHWSWAPVADPAVPDVKQTNWSRSPVDRFLLSAMEQQGYAPAAPADRHNWLRRVTFDLTGLPPTLEEIEAFIADESDEAYEKVVDRLLASPRYGEHWARHWMDLVRYGETKAHEADYSIPFVWRYRDYLIRAINVDVPFNQFAREAIAGDQLKNPRLNPEDGSNESAQGPGFFQLTDGHHGPPDIHSEEARVFDGMIDTTGKAFMGLTMTCARCHDHKFDAVSTKDYYAFYGLLASSRLDYPNVASPELLKTKRAELKDQQAVVKREAIAAVRAKIDAFDASALATIEQAADNQSGEENKTKDKYADNRHPLYPLASLLRAETTTDVASRWTELATDAGTPAASFENLGGLNEQSFGDWLTSGTGFENAPRKPGEFVIGRSGDTLLHTFVGGSAAAGQLSSRYDGSIKSPLFTVTDRLSVRVKGSRGRVRLYIQHYDIVGQGPTTSKTDMGVDKDEWHWIHFDTRFWTGATAYVEVLQNGQEMRFVANQQHRPVHKDDSYVAVDRIVVGSGHAYPPRYNGKYAAAWGIEASSTPPADQAAAVAFAKVQLTELVDRWERDELTTAQNDILEALVTAGGPLEILATDSPALLAEVERYRETWKTIPEPVYVRSMTDGLGHDEPVYVRGNPHATSEDVVPRRFFSAIDGKPFNPSGSGRLEWAEALVDENNPLTPRVIVNRIWQRVFGRGIVATVDNFGDVGDRPSHPELLDYLAREFMEDGWSRKRLLRRLVLTSAYRMSTTPSAEAAENDPDNVYLQRMPVKRLPAEAIRDAILATSGELRHEMYGRSVIVNWDQMPMSRSRPNKNGPRDGNGRRAIYVEMRRNYLPSFLTAFDMPAAAEPVGLRFTTNVPAQSLAMMNDPFVLDQAEAWSKRVLDQTDMSVSDRIDRMHRLAYSRPAREAEIERSLAMLRDLAASYEVAIDDAADESAITDDRVWKDFCHLMLNRKEFIFLY